MRFALHVTNNAKQLVRTRAGCPPLPVDGVPPAIETFQSMQYGLHGREYALANFAELYIYLRGGAGLHIPTEEWRDLLPKRVSHFQSTGNTI